MKKWCIITVTRNSSHIIRQYVDSHINFTSKDTDFYIVDNASSNRDVLKTLLGPLESNFRAIVKQRDKNFLFTDSTNLGLEMAFEKEYAYYCIMNPDIFVSADWQIKTEEYAKLYPNSGIIGFKLVKVDGILEHAGAFGGGEHRGRGNSMPDLVFNEAEEIDWVTGACMAFKHSVLRDVGFLDAKKYPHFSSDKEICMRAKKQGFNTLYVPVKLTHGYGKSSRPYVLNEDLPDNFDVSKIWNKLEV